MADLPSVGDTANPGANGDLPAKPEAERPHVLIADDDANTRVHLVRLLSERYNVKAVANGQAAMETIKQRTPDLILAGIMMPEMDGFVLRNTLRSDPKTKTIPVILLSARAGEESRAGGMQHGADDYLTKPFSARELLARVQTHLEMSQIRNRAEDVLRRQRERIDLVAEAADVGFWFCDLPFDKLIWDNRVKNHFWLRPESEVTIDTFYERLHPDDRERTRQTIEASISDRLPYDIEYRTVSPEGRQKWIRAIGRTFYDQDMRPKSFDGVTQDITESKQDKEKEQRITKEMVAATAKFRDVFEQSSVFAGIMTLDGIVIDANRLSLEACGYRSQDVLGRYFWETGWWHRSKQVQDKIRAGVQQASLGKAYVETLPYFWADGTERLVDFGLYPILDPAGKVIFLHPTGIDITERARRRRIAKK